MTSPLVCGPFIYLFIFTPLCSVQGHASSCSSLKLYSLIQDTDNFLRVAGLACILPTPLANFLSRLNDARTELGFYSCFYHFTEGKRGHSVNVGTTRGKHFCQTPPLPRTPTHTHTIIHTTSPTSLVRYSRAVVKSSQSVV